MKKQGVFTILLFMMVNSLFSQLKSSNTLLDTKINLTLKEVSIEHVLDTLHKVYDLNFSYINNDIPLERIVNLNFKHESLDKVLKHTLKGTNVKHYQISSQIVLRLENVVDPMPKDTIISKPKQEILIKSDSIYSSSIDTTAYSKSKGKRSKYNKLEIDSADYLVDSVKKIVVSDSIRTIKGDTIIRHRTITKRTHLHRKYLPPTFNRFEIKANILPGISFRSLKSTGLGNIEQTRRNTVESSTFTLGGGIRFDYYLKKRLFLETGIVYNRFAEKGKYDGFYLTTEFTPSPSPSTPPTQSPQQQPPPQPLPQSPPQALVTAVTKNDTSIQYLNTYEYIGIPFLVGFKSKTRVYVGVTSGFVVNYLIKSSTNYPSYISYEPTKVPATYESKESNFYYFEKLDANKHTLQKFNLSYALRLDFGIHITKSINFFASPSLNYTLTNIYSDQNKAISRPYVYGLETGLGISF